MFASIEIHITDFILFCLDLLGITSWVLIDTHTLQTFNYTTEIYIKVGTCVGITLLVITRVIKLIKTLKNKK